MSSEIGATDQTHHGKDGQLRGSLLYPPTSVELLWLPKPDDFFTVEIGMICAFISEIKSGV